MTQSYTRYLVVGSGSREHALAWALSQAPFAEVHCAPGNDGIMHDPEIMGQCHAIAVDDIEGLLDLATTLNAQLTVVGPELPLTLGIVDRFEAQSLPIWGPRAEAAKLEGSKAFAKSMMDEAGVPTAHWAQFDDAQRAMDAIKTMPHPLVIKADGLAGGKGVVISASVEESQQTLVRMMKEAQFGKASQRVIIEAFLTGREVSFMVATDGERVFPLMSSQDHKRVGEGDVGPNTGGMGAYSPSPLVTTQMQQEIITRVIEPVLKTMRERGTPFVGFLYAGLMCQDEANFQVLEFNVRLGDPETQALLFALNPSDLGATLLAILNGETLPPDVLQCDRAGFGVVLASEGYPGKITLLDQEITGLPSIDGPLCKVFFGGASHQGGVWRNRGGRVLSVTARGESLMQARQLAYEGVDKIQWQGMHCRRDMGQP